MFCWFKEVVVGASDKRRYLIFVEIKKKSRDGERNK